MRQQKLLIPVCHDDQNLCDLNSLVLSVVEASVCVCVLRFGVDLLITDRVFVMDAGASNSRDMKLLRSHLHELRSTILSVGGALSHTHAHIITKCLRCQFSS